LLDHCFKVFVGGIIVLNQVTAAQLKHVLASLHD
jgi:hypothetical protein